MSLLARFEENSRKYRCCCRCCHVKAAAILIGILELLYMAYQLINIILVWHRSDNGDHTASFAITVTGVNLGIIAVALMFYGVFSTKPYLLIPHLIMQVS